jgi:hypothetical protein
MKRLFLAVAITLLLSSGLAVAQDRILESDLQYQPSPSDIQVQPGVSPQMWLYLEEMKRQDDPRLAVRRKAEYRADQRMKRIATRQWFGVSAARPQASVTPFTGGDYSQFWGGNSSNSYRWIGVGNVWTIWPR